MADPDPLGPLFAAPGAGSAAIQAHEPAPASPAERALPAAFPAAFPAAQPSPRAWDSALRHRLRVLLHTAPLHDLRRGDALRDPRLRHYESLPLALKIMDLIVERTGLDEEVDRSVVLRELTPLLVAADEAAGLPADPVRHAEMVDRVLGHLRNDDDLRRPFEVLYQDLEDDGKAITRRLEFRLVSDHFHPRGGTVLRLSNEAVNLFLNALELDIEDAQAAAEAIVQAQLLRGKFEEAVQSARTARWHSLRFREKVERALRDTRRDIGRVDWREQIPRLLDDALVHVEVRLLVEREILHTAEDRLDALESDARAAAVAAVVRLVKDCRLRHGELQERLLGARNVFLEEQARQSFLPAPLPGRPDLGADVLEPLLRGEHEAAGRAVDEAFPAFVGAQAPTVLSLADLVSWLLRPRREPAAFDAPVAEQDLEVRAADVPAFGPASRRDAERLLAAIVTPTTLSELLDRAGAASEPAAVRELLALTALQLYAPEGGVALQPHAPDGDLALPLVVERIGSPLCSHGFAGDDLALGPRDLALCPPGFAVGPADITLGPRDLAPGPGEGTQPAGDPI